MYFRLLTPGCSTTVIRSLERLCKNMTDDDVHFLVLYSSKQESLKASSTSVLIGKKRKEATATETRA